MKYSCTAEHYAAHVALHREWSLAVGTPGYDKSAIGRASPMRTAKAAAW